MKKYRIIKYICILTSIGCLLAGCQKKAEIIQDNIENCEMDLLKTLTPKFIHKGGIDAKLSVVTVDISDFPEVNKVAFEEWVKDQFANDETVIAVKQGESYANFPIYQEEDVDQVTITFCREHSEEPLKTEEKISIHMSYISIFEAEGFEAEMKYQDCKWTIQEIGATYMS